MRKVKIQDKKVLDILNKKSALSTKGQNLLKEMEKLEKDFNKNLAQLSRIDEQARPYIKTCLSKLVLGEFEELSRVHQDENAWYMEISDRLEEFKTAFKTRGEIKTQS